MCSALPSVDDSIGGQSLESTLLGSMRAWPRPHDKTMLGTSLGSAVPKFPCVGAMGTGLPPDRMPFDYRS